MTKIYNSNLPEPISEIIQNINNTPLTLQFRTAWIQTIEELFSAVKGYNIMDVQLKLHLVGCYSTADDLDNVKDHLSKDFESIEVLPKLIIML